MQWSMIKLVSDCLFPSVGTRSLTLPTTSEIGIKGISVSGGVTEHHEIWVNSEGSAGNIRRSKCL